jgi:2-iminobutanoate/2-iminopropanoate deaminase
MPEIQRIPNTAGYPLSRAIRAGDLLLLSGQIPLDESGNVVRGDIAAQTHAVLKRIGETLQLAGAAYSDVVRATVWLADIGDFAAFNEVYRGYFAGGFPVRSTVQAKLALDVGIEIEVQAWLGAK